MTKTLGELIAFTPQANYSIDKNSVSQALKRIIDVTHQGNMAAFARTFQLPKNTVWMWCKGKSKPELRVILQICYCLDISLVDFISLKRTAYESVQIYPQRLPTIPKGSRRSPKIFDQEKIKIYLQAILNDSANPPINLQEVSKIRKDEALSRIGAAGFEPTIELLVYVLEAPEMYSKYRLQRFWVQNGYRL